MSKQIHELCKQCKYKCKMFDFAEIVICKWIKESGKAEKLNRKYIKKKERRK